MRTVVEAAPIEVNQPCEADLAALPEVAAVFVLRAGERSAYAARTTMLRRRVRRVVKLLGLGGILTRVEYWPVASALEGSLLHYGVMRRIFPDQYLKLIRLRMPAYVKVTLGNAFPRTQVSARLSSRALHYGPFRSRAEAENFESQFLDFFQLRRCQEDLAPSPAHPGCIYGEMNMCLRPCQQVVSVEEYRSEVQRVVDFLSTNGASLLASAAAARDRLSEEMNFEEAARQHQRRERIDAVLALRGELVRDVERLSGVVVTPALSAETVNLHFVWRGAWIGPVPFAVGHMGSSLDQRLREIVDGLEAPRLSVQERQEHLALLARWYYSSWREGDWIAIDDPARVPYRRIVRAVSKVLGGGAGRALK
jgi:excinuclease UvrABC nuclease subunit